MASRWIFVWSGIIYIKKLNCRCPVSGVRCLMSLLRSYVCILSATIYQVLHWRMYVCWAQPYIRSYIGFRLANPYLGCATMYEVPRWKQNMVAQPYIIPGQGNISRQNNMSSHIELLCDVLGLRRMSYVLTSVAAFIQWIPMYNLYPLLLPDYENTERQSPNQLVNLSIS